MPEIAEKWPKVAKIMEKMRRRSGKGLNKVRKGTKKKGNDGKQCTPQLIYKDAHIPTHTYTHTHTHSLTHPHAHLHAHAHTHTTHPRITHGPTDLGLDLLLGPSL